MKKNSSGMLGGIIGGLLVPYLFGYCGVRDGHSGLWFSPWALHGKSKTEWNNLVILDIRLLGLRMLRLSRI